MKKHLPTIFGALLIFASFGAFPTSLPGGALMLTAGLILLPASKNYLTSKVAAASLLNNNYVNYGLVVLLLAIGSSATKWSEKNSMINDFNDRKSVIIKQVTDYQDKKEFIKASVLIQKYLNVMPANEELISLKKENETKKADEEKLRAAKELAEREAANAKAYTPSDGSQPGYKYILTNTSTSRADDTVYSSYGACSAAKASKPTTDWTCIGRPKFTNEN